MLDCPDSSRNQTVDWNPKEVDVTFGQYETTSHWYVNVSWTALNGKGFVSDFFNHQL